MSQNVLLVVQGPTQALAAVSALSCSPEKNSSDYVALIGDTMSGSQSGRVSECAAEILRIFGIRIIYESTTLDTKFYTGQLTFQRYCEELISLLQLHNFAKVYVCRRMSLINEAVLCTFKQSQKICYGDGIGALDNGVPNYCTPISCDGFSRIDECRAVAPYEENWNGSLGAPVKSTGAHRFRSAVQQAATAFSSVLVKMRKEIEQVGSPLVIATLANLVECRYMASADDEVRFYRKNIRTLLPQPFFGTLLLKSHPRETCSQGRKLADQLSQEGYRCIRSDAAQQIPTEILLHVLKPSMVVPILSSSGATARLLDPNIEIRFGSDNGTQQSPSTLQRLALRGTILEKHQALTWLLTYPWKNKLRFSQFVINALMFRDLSVAFPPISNTQIGRNYDSFWSLQNSTFKLLLMCCTRKARRLRYIIDYLS